MISCQRIMQPVISMTNAPCVAAAMTALPPLSKLRYAAVRPAEPVATRKSLSSINLAPSVGEGLSTLHMARLPGAANSAGGTV